jgi:hypothetical protein
LARLVEFFQERNETVSAQAKAILESRYHFFKSHSQSGIVKNALWKRIILVRSVQDFRESKPASNRRRSILQRRQPRSHAFARCRFCRQIPREMASPETSRALSSRARRRRIATEFACSFVSVLTVVGRRIRHSKDGVSASSIVYRIDTNSEMTNWPDVCCL